MQEKASISELLGGTSHKKRYKAMCDELRSDLEFGDLVKKAERCHSGRRCNLPICYECNVVSNGVPRHKSTERENGSIARNYKKVARQRFTKNFRDFNERDVCVLTVDFKPVKLDVNSVRQAIKQFREKLNRVLKRKIEIAVCIGKFEITLKRAGETSPNCYDRADYLMAFPAEEVIAHLHLHALLWGAGMSMAEVEQVIKEHFPGVKQTDIRKVEHKFDADGNDLLGIGGWGEYAALRIPELNFGKENPDILRQYLRVITGIHSNSFNYSFGLRPKGNPLRLAVWDWVCDGHNNLIPMDLDTDRTLVEIKQELNQDYLRNQQMDFIQGL
ncbi:MAG: hypothetical protein HWE34_00860 [Methylocystaceae bacterium]|nr:hypothetical protein [Methylocystaceae bacterium]